MRLSVLIFVWFVFWPIPNASGQDSESYRVLFLGNSRYYASGGPLQPFEGFCRAEGLLCETVNQGRPPPERSPHGIEFSGLGRIDPSMRNVARDERVRELISSGGFNYVVVHSRSNDFVPDWVEPAVPDWVETPVDVPSYVGRETTEAFKDLHRVIVEAGATTVVTMSHMVSSYVQQMHIVAEEHQRLKEELDAMMIGGSRHPVILVPTGLFWMDAMHKFGLESWYADSAHGTSLAQYATGALFYTYLTGRDPRQNVFAELPVPWRAPDDAPKEFVPATQAEWVKNLAWWYYSHY